MSERINDGGPAFPHQFQDAMGHPEWRQSTGMTLRDYFAAKAMAAFIRRAVTEDDWLRLGLASYECADAMIAAREGGKQ